jgi:hypothetical protein
MSLTSEDMKRVTDLAQFSKEFFTVEFRASTNTLSLIVDGSKRNTIELDNAEEEYEKLLVYVKNAFIDFRKPKASDIKN